MANVLYLSVVEDLKKKIINGELKPNDMLKSESELMREYKVSRMTLRKSLSFLSNEGYIYSVPGKGNFVRQPDNDIYQFRFPDINSIAPKADEIKLSSVTIKKPDECGLEDTFKSKMLVQLERLIFCSGETIGIEIVYTPYIPNKPVVEDKLNFANYSKVIEMKYAFALKKELEIEICCPPAHVVKKLKINENDFIFKIDKLTKKKDENITLTLCIMYLKKEYFSFRAQTPEEDDSRRIF